MTMKHRPLRDEEKQYAHRFAAEQFLHENRALWTRVVALLMVNSLLVAGFMLLYGSKNPNDTLLLTIAASGILIQVMWPIFAISSFRIFEYWGKLMEYIEKYCLSQAEECQDIEWRVRKIWTCYGDSVKPPTAEKWEKRTYCLEKLPPGAYAAIIFFLIFLAIWIVATVIADCSVGRWIAISLGIPVIVIAILCVVRWRCIAKRMKI
jgi:hypothetical protein